MDLLPHTYSVQVSSGLPVDVAVAPLLVTMVTTMHAHISFPSLAMLPTCGDGWVGLLVMHRLRCDLGVLEKIFISRTQHISLCITHTDIPSDWRREVNSGFIKKKLHTLAREPLDKKSS